MGPATRRPLTRRQRRIIAVITDHVIDHGFPPTLAEIGRGAGVRSTSAVAYQVQRLTDLGHLYRLPGKTRALAVAAGSPA